MTTQTAKPRRRKLRFSSYEELLDEARKLAGVPTRQLGNWSLGQVCEHLSKGMDMAVDGAPFSPPWLVRIVGPLLKRRILTRGMSAGFQLPKGAAALLPDPVSAADGLARLENSITRLRATTDRKRNVIFGRMSAAEWDQLQFRHAELHLSFIEPV